MGKERSEGKAQALRDELLGREIRTRVSRRIAAALGRRDAGTIRFEDPAASHGRLLKAAELTRGLARSYPHGSWWRIVRPPDADIVLTKFAASLPPTTAYVYVGPSNLTGAWLSDFAELASATRHLVAPEDPIGGVEDLAGLSEDLSHGIVLHTASWEPGQVELIAWSAADDIISKLPDLGADLPTAPSEDQLYGLVG